MPITHVKAITLIEPWATLLAHGQKIHETRTWATYYRGPLLIHAGKKTLAEIGFDPFADRAFATALARCSVHCDEDFRRAHVLGVVTLVNCMPTPLAEPIPDKRFGDFSPGRWAWLCANAVPAKTPMPRKGAMGLFGIPIDELPEDLHFEVQKPDRWPSPSEIGVGQTAPA